jgi:hypothetical protein
MPRPFWQSPAIPRNAPKGWPGKLVSSAYCSHVPHSFQFRRLVTATPWLVSAFHYPGTVPISLP